MEPRQADQHFLVTGGGTGIGRAIALRLVREGARVSIAGRRRGPLEEVAATAPQSIGWASVDIQSPGEIESALTRFVGRSGPLRGVVCCAGVGGGNEAGPGDRFFELVETNLVGTYRTIRAALPQLLPGPDTRHVVVMSSILARFGVPGYTGYCAAKTGLLGLTRALALELAPDCVQVNALCPGWVETDMAWEGIDAMARGLGTDRAGALAEAMKPVPFGRMSQPEDVAGMVAWLVSNDARGVTGQTLDMNNGAFMA